MKEKIISEKFSFDEICKILKNRSDDFWNCFDDIFSLALLFFPDAAIPLGINSTVFEDGIKLKLKQVKEGLKDARKSIKKLVKKNSVNSYYEQYNNIQIANFLLLFASYFDAMNALIPDESFQIELKPSEKIQISQEHFEKHLKASLDSANGEEAFANVRYPVVYSLIVPYEHSKKILKNFYSDINKSFRDFYVQLIAFESLKEYEKEQVMAYIRELPDAAVEYYTAEYLALKTEFQFYHSFAEIAEREQQIDRIERAIREFNSEQTDWISEYQNKQVEAVFDQLNTHYRNLVQKRILHGEEKEDSETPVLPLIKDIFVPQAFKSLIYKKSFEKEPISLEPDSTWKDIKEKDNLVEHLQQALNHPVYGRKPLIVLGNPGAGKSTLSYMLASKIFGKIYNTVVIRLREVNANDEISTQVEQQIYKAIHTRRNWSDIRDCIQNHHSKPLLLIFDGFDELLQASGREYKNYIKSIQAFQENNEKDFGFFVKAIVTSRRTLIDTADIGNNSVVVNLLEFDNDRILKWVSIWNQKNKDYFAEKGLKPLEIKETDNYYHLAKQPLLLTLLAIYDSKDNALSEDKSLDITQLYNRLIYDFIDRECKKSDEFCQRGTASEIEEDFFHLNIAAMGMFNRNSTILSADEFVKDLKCFHAKVAENDGYMINQGLKEFGSFFFVNTSKSSEEIKREVETKNAYEFLHNTFGEYLAGNMILKQCIGVLKAIEFAKYNHSRISLDEKWFLCLSFVPLFSRPNIINMIFMESKHYQKKLDRQFFDELLKNELQLIISGNKAIELNEIVSNRNNPYDNVELLKCMAVYCINLVTLAGIVFNTDYSLFLSAEEWNKLISIWRYAFDEDELFKFASMFQITHQKDNLFMIEYYSHYDEEREYEYSELRQVNRLEKINTINRCLCDEVNHILSGALSGDYSSLDNMEKHGLPLQVICVFTQVRNAYNQKNGAMELLRYTCVNSQNTDYFLLFLKYINYQLRLGERFSKRFLSDTLDEACHYLSQINNMNFKEIDFMYYRKGSLLRYFSEVLAETLDLTERFLISANQYDMIQYLINRGATFHNRSVAAMLRFQTRNISIVMKRDTYDSLMIIRKEIDYLIRNSRASDCDEYLSIMISFITEMIKYMGRYYVPKKHISYQYDFLNDIIGSFIDCFTSYNIKKSQYQTKEDIIMMFYYWHGIVSERLKENVHLTRFNNIYHWFYTPQKILWINSLLENITDYSDKTVRCFFKLIYDAANNFSQPIPEYFTERITEYLKNKGTKTPIEVLRVFQKIIMYDGSVGLRKEYDGIIADMINTLSS